jgi:hypothetical protein
MQKNTVSLCRHVAFFLTLPLFVSCNIYGPFQGATSNTDYQELGTKCLNQGDYNCAISNFSMLPDGDTRNENLCEVYIAKTGFTISVLVNVVTQQSSQMLGSLAQAFVPWNATQASDAVSGATFCNTFANSPTSGNSGILLKSIGLLVDCAVRIAKTDQFLGSDTNDSVCQTPGNNNGLIQQNDIISGNGPVMCSADAVQCAVDISQISASDLGNANLSNLQGAYNNIPTGLKNSSAGADSIRTAIQSAVPN